MFENVYKCMEMYRNVWKCLKIKENVGICKEMIENVRKSMTLRGLAIVVLARAYVFLTFFVRFCNVFKRFSYVFCTFSVGRWLVWSGPGGGQKK